MTNHIISPEQSNHKLHRKVAAATLGAVLLAGAGGVEVNRHETADHISQEAKQFTYKGLFDHYKELGIKPEDVTVQPVGEFESTAPQIAEDLHAKDVETVAQEIYVQLDGKIKPGEMIVIPKDQLAPHRI